MRAGRVSGTTDRVDTNISALRVAVIVPTLNAGFAWKNWLAALDSQTLQPEFKLIIDSSSTDQTAAFAEEHGFNVRIISRDEFDHGGTRLLAANLLDKADILVYLTQDAILASKTSLECIVGCFSDPLTASVYGRQLPALNATALAAHHRSYNYPKASYSVSRTDLERLGIRAVFCSNSFAAYRRSTLLEQGGFRERLIMGEDMFAALMLIEAGYKHRYCAEAVVFHSHNFSLPAEFRRFFDMGVFHKAERRIDHLRASTRQEGRGYVYAELSFAWKKSIVLFYQSLIRNSIRAFAYVMGRNYRLLPLSICRWLSNSGSYWQAHSFNKIKGDLK